MARIPQIILLIVLIHHITSWCFKTSLQIGNEIREVDWSHDDSTFISIHKTENALRIFDAKSFQLLKIYQYIVGGVAIEPTCAKISKDSKWIGVGYLNSDAVILYNTAPFNVYFIRPTSQTQVKDIDFNYGSNQFVTCGKLGVIKFWSLPATGGVNGTQTPVNSHDFGTGGAHLTISCRWGPNGDVVLTNVKQQIRYYSSSGTASLLNINTENVMQEDFLPGSGTFWIVTSLGKFGQNMSTSFMTDSGGQLNSISVGKGSKYVALGGVSKILYIYDQSNTPVLQAKFQDFSSTINSVRISKNQDIIIVGTLGGEIKIYGMKCSMINECESGQYMNSTGSCKKCVDSIDFCLTCKSSSACELCAPGYYNVGSGCTACHSAIGYCIECKDNTECFKCLDGYYLDSTGTKKCVKCPQDGCIQCNTSAICTKCFKNDYFLDTSTNSCKQCTETLPYCIRCLDSNNCSDCQIGFYKNSSKKCTECPGNCLACQSDTNCTECKVGYYANGGTCNRCTDSDCISCNQTGVCYDCKDGNFLTTSNACSACVSPCSTCSVASNNCTGCNIGYYLNAASFTCVKCIENCRFCNDSSKCLNCFPGFKVDSTSFTCKACSNYHGNCSECTHTKCIKCRDGYWIDTAANDVCKTCVSVIPKCMSCTSDTKCISCAIGYFHTGNTGSTSCSACATGCQECISSSNCTNCFPTFRKNGLVCEPCKSNCFQCASDVLCSSCVTGFYLDVSTCKSCQSALAYCSICADSATCVTCMPKTYLDSADSKCKLCSLANCLTCTKTACYSCKNGFYLDTAVTPNVCSKCSEFCQECTSSTVCTSCVDGYFFDSSDNKCKPCSVSFPHCTLCDSSKCLLCDQGTQLNTTNNNVCTTCTNFITNCKICFWDNTAAPIIKCSLCNFGFGLAVNNLTCPACSTIYGCIDCKNTSLCTKCEIGFYLKNDNTCGLCAQNCLTCSSALTCIACKEGYVSDGTGCALCETKIGGCSKCIQDTATNFNCTYCQIGYFLSAADKKCYICHESIKGCYTCNDSTSCTACLEKYFLETSSAPNCKKCVASIPGCQICNSSSVCLSCENSYFLDATTSNCKFCSKNLPGCQYCKNDSVCSQCESGYYLTTGNVCSLCESALEGCINCNSMSFCVQCRAGYYLSTTDTKCYKCTLSGCDVCNENSPSVCITCNSKHYLDGNICKTCQTRVLFCDECDTTNCYQCQVGYFLQSPSSCATCSSSISGCSRCVDNNVCLQCMSSYFVNSNNQCQQCNKVMFGCQNCINATTCISCEANFFLNLTSDKCQPCTDIDGCMLCRNEKTCVMCQEKYFMKGSDCTLCSKVMKGCFSCASDTVCIQCQSGYVLDPAAYSCKVNTVEAKEGVQGIKLVSYYISKNMLKHVMIARGVNFKKSDTLNITANGMTKIFVQDYTGKEVQLNVLSYEFGKSGNTIIFYTDNPIAEKMEEKTKKMEFRRLLEGKLLETDTRLLETEINMQVLVKMDESVYREILPDLDYKGSMTVGYSLNNPEFMNSYVTAEAGSKYLMYEVVGMATVFIFLVNYIIKFLFTMPQSRNRSTLLPHIIALKSCCLILYPSHFEYISFCKGFMIVDLPWLNSLFASNLTDLSDVVLVPFGLFFQNMSIAGTFLLGFIAYVVLILIVQAYFYITKDPEQPKSEKTESQIDSDELRKTKQKFKIQNLEEAIGINYDNDDSEIAMKKRNFHELFWNFFTFSMCYYSCLNVQGAFYNYQQILTLSGSFYIFGMLVFIYVTIETFYAFFRNFRNISKVRIYIKACLLSLAHFNPIYVVSVCVIFDGLMVIMQFYVANKPNQFSKYFVLTHLLSSIVIGLMIFVSGSLVSLFSTALCLVICFGFELFIHIKEYKNANKDVDEQSFRMDEEQKSVKEGNLISTDNVWDLGKKTKNVKQRTQQNNMNNTQNDLGQWNQEFKMTNVNFQKVSSRYSLSSNKIDGQKKELNSKQKQVEIINGGRRNQNRKTQSFFASNVVEVGPSRNLSPHTQQSKAASRGELQSNNKRF